MKLIELLKTLQSIKIKIGSSEPFITGGTPRDRYMKRLDNISDIDITTGDKSIQYLSSEFGIELAKKYNIIRKNFEDGHAAIYIGKFKMDFSSNFNIKNIDKILAKIGIAKPTEIQKEMFSRDFTCNALLLSLDLKSVIDLTNHGIKDIDNKIIRTCLDPEITLVSNNNRVIRAVYLASKLDFDIDDKIIEFVKKNPSSIKISTKHVFVEKLNEAFIKNSDRAAYYISKMNLWDLIPITEVVRPFFLKKHVLMGKKAYFQGGRGVNEPTPKKKKYKSDEAIINQSRFKEPFYSNYDLYDILEFEHIGPGAGWHSMQKYKNISEFLKAKREKIKDKYKGNDSWIQDNGEITKNNLSSKNNRAKLLSQIIKNSIDFTVDEQIKNPMSKDIKEDTEEDAINLLEIGNFYTKFPLEENVMNKLIDKYLPPQSFIDEYGLPDGFDHSYEEDVVVEKTNPYYGTLGPESLMYEDKWNI